MCLCKTQWRQLVKAVTDGIKHKVIAVQLSGPVTITYDGQLDGFHEQSWC